MGNGETRRSPVPPRWSPCVSGASWGRLSDGGTGGSESQRDKDSTKTGHGLTVLFFFLSAGRAEAKLGRAAAAVFHISTPLPLPAAILSGQ